MGVYMQLDVCIHFKGGGVCLYLFEFFEVRMSKYINGADTFGKFENWYIFLRDVRKFLA